jgi:hypothetical protein
MKKLGRRWLYVSLAAMSDVATLYGLHRVVQIAFGWEDYHLHAFKLHGSRYGTMWTGEVMLADLQLRACQRIIYEYDFGNLWEHEIRVEAKLEREGGKAYPVSIVGACAGPPEYIGGPEGLMMRSSIGSASLTSTGCLVEMMMKMSTRNSRMMMHYASSSPSASAGAR